MDDGTRLHARERVSELRTVMMPVVRLERLERQLAPEKPLCRARIVRKISFCRRHNIGFHWIHLLHPRGPCRVSPGLLQLQQEYE